MKSALNTITGFVIIFGFGTAHVVALAGLPVPVLIADVYPLVAAVWLGFVSLTQGLERRRAGQ